MAAKKNYSFEQIELFLKRLSEANKSLKTLDISLSVKQAVEIQPSLVEALAAHSELEEVRIEGTLRCTT